MSDASSALLGSVDPRIARAVSHVRLALADRMRKIVALVQEERYVEVGENLASLSQLEFVRDIANSIDDLKDKVQALKEQIAENSTIAKIGGGALLTAMGGIAIAGGAVGGTYLIAVLLIFIGICLALNGIFSVVKRGRF